ncbi:MAG TPA: NAD(P)H-dependent oxidoreductase subunit E [Dehalococcoidia bacterium]|nr:NAD(P)H-dependent oxidoreductase subunit E [Dehalococcoidia bacterium]
MSDHLQNPSAQNEDRQNLLLRLVEAQNRFGCLSEQVMEDLAESLGVAVSEVYGVATFYSFLSTRPKGKYVIRVCKGLPCCLKDFHLVVGSIEEAINIRPGETTPDGKFSLELTNCIGACDNAPAMLINSDLHTDLTPQGISQILDSYE